MLCKVDLILSVKLSFNEDTKKNDSSVADLRLDLMLVPQATLGGKLKGKALQYHANISKQEGAELYHSLVMAIRQTTQGNSAGGSEHQSSGNIGKVVCGTFGNQQVLEMSSLGPYTHYFEI